MPEYPLSVFWLFLLPVFNIGLWMLFPQKRQVWGVLPAVFLFGFWLYLLLFSQEPGFSFQEKWIFSDDFRLGLSFLPDSRRIFLAWLSSFLTLLIQVYSLAWLPKSSRWGLYQLLLTTFCLAMNGLFMAGNLFTLLIFWELVGLTSYLLVQFWFEKNNPARAGLRVFLVNKLGDLALISGIGLLVSFGMGGMVSDNLGIPGGAVRFFQSPAGSVLTGFLVLAALIKSAQFPFSIWLKEAMQGPAPVSALLHSATMVVAGVWLLVQLSPAFGPELHWILVITGGFTFLFFNGLAIFSGHLKNILAFSTMAQLGMMVMAVGSGRAEQSLLHLVGHAFFKSGLFLICGWLMLSAAAGGKENDEQQFIPNLKGYLSRQPLLKWAFLFFLFGLAGWPLSAGFISKELLLPQVSQGADSLQWLAYVIFQAGIGMSAFYAFRLALFLGFSDSDSPHFQSISSPLFSVPVLILAILSGFWIFGPHPFSASGWLPGILMVPAETVFPDVIMLLAGSALAWFCSERQQWRAFVLPGWWSRHWAAMQIFSLAVARSGQFLMRASGAVRQSEEKLLDKPLQWGSAVFLVGGYFTAFLDKYVVDGLINGLATLCRQAGSMLWSQARRSPQYVGFFVFVLICLCLYFSFK